ncbi:Receptor kinase [Zostera marina]|uniref:non-specific serine/threonine protein kinase n=1 Tax=Zostera marina TaxID=29655 RepID=A0A0K9Q671_ZOSMR|nr:Receptor kinase [Zostera marina]
MLMGNLHLLLVLFFSLLQLSYQLNQTCSPSDLKALRGFTSGLGFEGVPGWELASSSDCCLWVGVTCISSSSSSSSSISRVSGLNLSGLNLNGSVSESLVGLSDLRTLNLSRNSLSGDVPASLFRMLKLEILDLSVNGFTGDVPMDCNLPSIREFNISFNSFTASSHPILVASTFLSTFDISGNNFGGQVRADGLCNNSVPSSSSSSSSSSQVRQLRFSRNRLVGDFPVGFGNCQFLEVLHLDSNFVSGGLPSDLFGLSSLRELHVGVNLLAGVIDPRLGDLSNLTSLDLSSNQFNGTLPSLLSNKLSAIRVLNFGNNSLVGNISHLGDFTSVPYLSFIDLGSNSLSGGIPSQLSSCISLRTLNLAKNNLSGEIPKSFANLKELSSLSLSINWLTNLTSAMTILQHCPNLTSLVLTRNFIGETLPAELGIIPDGFPKLSLLVIANCGLKGGIPPWLSNFRNLQLLDISWNHLNGRIPDWFGDFDSMFYLDLSNNSLSGEIPLNLTKIAWLVGTSNGGVSSALTVVELPFFSKRKDSVKGFQYNQVTSFPPSLFLSDNRLNGSIWPEFGDLRKLQVLDFSANNLTGNIPDELSKMSNLETVELFNNNLTGEIPSSLTKLNFLSKFNVSHNNLSGPIPTGGQFLTFDDTSFAGNPDLCGDRSSLPPCDNNNNNNNTDNKVRSSYDGVKSEKKKNKIIIGVVSGISIGTGLISIFVIVCLFVKRAQSHSGRIQVLETEIQEAVDSATAVAGEAVVVFENTPLTIADILKSTGNFDEANIIGCGGFGLVYKATLANGQKMAIKRLSGDFGQMEREFRAEIDTLSRALHQNLVVLQGYCRMASVRILMYSYMENGSLDFWLHENNNDDDNRSRNFLDWGMRLEIAKGASKGLEYLHLNCQPHIIHRDIKSSNILLDQNFKAHLADFGLARLIKPYDTHVTTDLVGTLGYIPPEYGHSSMATLKGDIYSFGVVLLELVTGRRPIDVCQPRGHRELIPRVLQMNKENRVNEVLDVQICSNKQNQKQMERVLQIACLCLSQNPKDRPSIHHLVLWLHQLHSSSSHVNSINF